MKLFSLLTGSFLCFSLFAQNKPQLKELTPINGVSIETSKKTMPNPYRKELKANEPQFLQLENKTKQDIQSVELIEDDKFEEVKATKFSDPNYEKNIVKSKAQQDRMNAKPNAAPLKLSDKQRIANYKIELEKYEVNSVEYNLISEKINILKSK
jgi:hypothetical protein